MIVDEGLVSNSLGHSILSKPLLIRNIAKWTVFDFWFCVTVLIFNNLDIQSWCNTSHMICSYLRDWEFKCRQMR